MVIGAYQKEIQDRISVPPSAQGRAPNASDERLVHLATMFPKAIGFFEEGRVEKGFRWLGFIQGVLWSEGIYTVEQLKNHNRPSRSVSGDNEE